MIIPELLLHVRLWSSGWGDGEGAEEGVSTQMTSFLRTKGERDTNEQSERERV